MVGVYFRASPVEAIAEAAQISERLDLSLDQRLAAFAQLGRVFDGWGRALPWPGLSCGLTQEEYTAFEAAIAKAGAHNGWFTGENVRHMLLSLARMLDAADLRQWVVRYPASPARRTVGIIMAGNVPLVGFHDLLCVLLSDHRARVKCSTDDRFLIPAVIEVLERFAPGIHDQVVITDGKLGDVDAIIATGSNNTARYFEHYFGHLPRIVRKGRVSVALLDGTESDEELAALGEDVFRYFGLGCRNVSKLYAPRDFDIDRFFKAMFPWKSIIEHHKYANNFDYNRAVWLLDQIPFLENGFLQVKEDAALASPVASLHLERYNDRSAVLADLEGKREAIQCVVGHGFVPFGSAQFPKVDDYADGVDTMAFLGTLAHSGTHS